MHSCLLNRLSEITWKKQLFPTPNDNRRKNVSAVLFQKVKGNSFDIDTFWIFVETSLFKKTCLKFCINHKYGKKHKALTFLLFPTQHLLDWESFFCLFNKNERSECLLLLSSSYIVSLTSWHLIRLRHISKDCLMYWLVGMDESVCFAHLKFFLVLLRGPCLLEQFKKAAATHCNVGFNSHPF